MIRFYRPMDNIKAITFDLDDTLYDNRPIMQRTEQQVVNFLHQHYPELAQISVDDLQQLRADLLTKEPEIYHNVSQWRWRSLECLLLKQGYSVELAQEGANGAMAEFNHWRNQIIVTENVKQTLQALSQQFALAVITNGNANPDLFGIGHFFQFVLRAGPDGRAKPYSDMYQQASQRFDLPLSQILHVGDHLLTDVAGAVMAGAQACWINDANRDLLTDIDSRILPHIEISRLDSLLALL